MHKIFSPHLRRSLVMYDFAPDPSEFPNIWGKFYFIFYQCALQLCVKGIKWRFRNVVFALMGFIRLSSATLLSYCTCTNRTNPPPPSFKLQSTDAQTELYTDNCGLVVLGCNGEYFLRLVWKSSLTVRVSVMPKTLVGNWERGRAVSFLGIHIQTLFLLFTVTTRIDPRFQSNFIEPTVLPIFSSKIGSWETRWSPSPKS